MVDIVVCLLVCYVGFGFVVGLRALVLWYLDTVVNSVDFDSSFGYCALIVWVGFIVLCLGV